MNTSYMKLKALGILCASSIALVGCGEFIAFKAGSVGLYAVSQGVFSSPDVNLKEKNYAAADLLASRMSHELSINDAIGLLPLEELDNPGVSSPLGMEIASGVGGRFEELGYDVMFSEVTQGGEKSLFSDLEQGRIPKAWLKGSYIIKGKNVSVSLRVVSRVSQSVVAKFDYEMPVSSEIYKLAQTPTQIIRIEQE